MSPTARGRQAREKLLTAAVQLVGEVGWNAVSTRLLAERAGVLPGVVHYHFPSLSALLREAAVGVLRDVLAGVRPALDRAATPEDGLAALFGLLDDHTGHDPASLVVVEAYLAATRDPELHRALRELVTEFRRDVAAWLAAHGHDRPEQTASVLAATVDGILLHRPLNPQLGTQDVLPVLRKLLAPG
ncbi:TetR/AcrR family transcriptional regulator [Prauserella muralis]|uniref:TetR family transcriptional regulator n=1 Tax=Prauserella muralis TaxID=588067 RepID=A0A2V4APH6_9PSEU|nr:TetR/AcrR family transcriptional regulator [Prauserella muralis]PXY22502.1 TetR family transcriptional regulator [Prauserella muralis]TWE28181.1 TetR family transcriptional regulator [Prauserella muralis]